MIPLNTIDMIPDATNILIYVFLFTALFYEVFLLITYFENREEMKEENRPIDGRLKRYPTVSIVIPCWNEETTLGNTVHSLLHLDYPKNKLNVIIVDDGSTDNTWDVAQKFARNPQVQAFHKENGGKHTALNFALTHITTEFVGCLDADSLVHKDALKQIMFAFQEHKDAVVVTPSIHVWKPKNLLQLIQRVEYGWGIFIRKMFSYLDAMYVTPGPFSIFRRDLFDKIGFYKHAYLTEDMEMALRIQSHHYKMINAHNAKVFTITPNTLYKLYKQRLRWTYGYIKNAIDYRYMFFKKEYGNLGFLVLPTAVISIFSSLYVITISLLKFSNQLWTLYIKFKTVGFDFSFHPFTFSIDWFTFHTEIIAIMSIIAFLGTLTLIFLSRKMAEGHVRIGWDLLYFLTLYAFIAPLWLARAVWNTVFSVRTTWR